MARLTPAVMRALDILELFAQRGERLAPTEVVEATGLPKSTVHELLATLTARGYLLRDANGNHRLGYAAMSLGHAYAERFDMLAAANEAARRTAFDTGETCSVAVLEGTDVFYLAKVEGREVLALASSVGKRVSAHQTALGKALLADLDERQLRERYAAAVWTQEPWPRRTPRTVATMDELESHLERTRARGWAIEVEESGPDVACIAAPIRDAANRAVAAISLSLPLLRWESVPEQKWGQVVTRAAAQVSQLMGHQGSPS